MKKVTLFMTALLISFSAFALNKESVDGANAIAIIGAMEKLNIQGQREGSSDTGYVNIRHYELLGMECYSGMSAYGGYGSKLEASCYFDGVKSAQELNKIRTVLAAAGLKSSNRLYK